MSTADSYTNITVETHGKVGLITLNRPKALNALNDELMLELGEAIRAFDLDEGVCCLVITGNERAFAAGADIKAMVTRRHMDVFKANFTANWDSIARCRKPVIAAVAGFALGGGCELALMADIVYAADTARFGLPEVKLGLLPGAGGTQRMPRAIGKAKAMELCLTGMQMDAHEAERCGLVARVVPAADLLETALATARTIASHSMPAVMMIKESINRAYESSLNEGLLFERRSFHTAFALEDRREGMEAFIEKRLPVFRHR